MAASFFFYANVPTDLQYSRCFCTVRAFSVILLYTKFQRLEEIGQVTLYIVEIKFSVTSQTSSGFSEKRGII